MIPNRTIKTIRTHRHLGTMRSDLSSARPTRERWPRLRETEQIQRELRRLPHQQPEHSEEILL